MLIFYLRLTVWPPGNKSSKNSHFARKYVIAFDSAKARHLFCQHLAFLVETLPMNNKITFKGHFEKLTKGLGHDLMGCTPFVWECFEWFSFKRGAFIFLPLTIVSQNWPDLRSLIWKFWDTDLIETVTHINRWKFQGDRSFGVAMMIIQTFLR